MAIRSGTALALLCLVGALAGVAYGLKLERDGLRERDEAIAEGVTKQARVLGSLRGRPRRVRVRFVLDDVERRAVVFPDRAYVEGLLIEVAYLPAEPERLYIVGATPWNWWTMQRHLFVIAAVVAGLAAIGSVVLAPRAPPSRPDP